VSTGYNGPPSRIAHCKDEEPCHGSPLFGGMKESCIAIHAELNAVLQAAASRRIPFTAYCSLSPCLPCAQALLGAGVKEVVALDIWRHGTDGPRLLNKAGVLVWVWRNSERTPWLVEAEVTDGIQSR